MIAAKLLDRILSKCTLGPLYNGLPCWLWQASCCNKGYPHIKLAGVARRAHRVLWELVAGRPIGAGMTLDHLCLNTSCVRPEHLEEVTRPVNTARGNRTRHQPKEMRI